MRGFEMEVGSGGLLGPGALNDVEARACLGGEGAVDGDERNAVKLRIWAGVRSLTRLLSWICIRAQSRCAV